MNKVHPGISYLISKEQNSQIQFSALPIDVIDYLIKNFLREEERIPLSMVSKELKNLVDRSILLHKRNLILRRIINNAASLGNVDLVEWCHKKLKYPWNVSLFESAAQGGNLTMLNYLLQ